MPEWNGEINPNDEQYQQQQGGSGERTKWCSAGKKILAPLGYERWESSNHNPMLSVRFLCLEDMEEGGDDEGGHVWKDFALTQNAVQFFARFARAMGHLAPFNVFKDEDVQAILAKGAVICRVVVEEETYQGKKKTKREARFFDPFEGEWDPNWTALCEEGEVAWDRYLEWRANNPRNAQRQGRSSGGSSSGSGGSGGGSLPAADDDIPF